MYPNIEEDNVELAYLNKEIDKVKKQLLADRQSKYESVPQPKTQVGWASYIVNNDRGLLDKYQDAERAWYNKLKDQELAYAQMKNAKEIAEEQQKEQAAYRMDDNMKNRSLALNKLQYAEAALKNDTSGDALVKAALERDVRNAKEELKYWDKAIGIEYKEVNDTARNDVKEAVKEAVEEDSKDDTTTSVKIKDYSYITKIKNQAEKDAILKEMEANPAIKNNESFREQYNRIKGITPEDKKADIYKAKLQKWRKEYDALTSSRQREWKELNPDKAKAIGV